MSSQPPACQPCLIGPGGQPICCWGEEWLQLRFSSRLFVMFLKAEVTFPILWVDFLRKNCLSVFVVTNQLIDSNGVTFCLIEEPSGHTASVMLPANVLKQRAEPAHPRVTSHMEGLGATYEAVAARGTPHPATAERAAAAAIRRGDFIFNMKPPPPAAVPGWVDSGGDAEISTPSSLHLQLLLPPLGGQLGVVVPAPSRRYSPSSRTSSTRRVICSVGLMLLHTYPWPPSSGGWTLRSYPLPKGSSWPLSNPGW
jgi:hypothetical protein